MSRIGIVSVLAMVLAAALSGDSPNKAKTHGYGLSGTVASVDESRKTFVVKNAAGKDTTLLWTSSTTIVGSAQGRRKSDAALSEQGRKAHRDLGGHRRTAGPEHAFARPRPHTYRKPLVPCNDQIAIASNPGRRVLSPSTSRADCGRPGRSD